MRKRDIFICSLLLLIFLFITILVLTNNTVTLDNTIYNKIISIRSNFFDTFFKSITKLGNTLTILYLIIILLLTLDKDNRYILGIGTISIVLINQLLKHIIRRVRPNILRLIKQGGYSYPSGHSMISIAIYGFLIYLVNKKIKNIYLRITLTVLLLFIIIGIGISRIYLGVHFPTDVLGGYTLAIMIEIIVISIYKKYFKEYENDKDGCK